MKQLLLIALFALALAVPARPARAHSTCQLYYGSQYVIVVRNPCYYHDFPRNCRVPSTIWRGMRVYCPTGGAK